MLKIELLSGLAHPRQQLCHLFPRLFIFCYRARCRGKAARSTALLGRCRAPCRFHRLARRVAVVCPAMCGAVAAGVDDRLGQWPHRLGSWS